MNKLVRYFYPACWLVFAGAGLTFGDDSADWPRWRGPDANGSATHCDPPTTWSETENLRWKADLPGSGGSSPIVFGDRVFVATAMKTDRAEEGSQSSESDPQTQSQETSPAGARGGSQRGGFADRRGGPRFGGGPAPTNYYAFMVLAYDRVSGKEVWRTTLTEQMPHEAGHVTNTFASASPVTDGKQIYISFGSRGLFGLDLDGNKIWQRDLGKMQTRNRFGEGSSPSLYEDTLVVPFDHEADSFIVALDAKSGDEKWRQPRDEQTTWATPLITEYQGRVQVITNGSNRVRSYDLATGELIWQCGGQAVNPIPSPVRFEDNVIVMTGYRGYAVYSIPLNSEGDITDSDSVSWIYDDAAPYVPSPLLHRGQLYFTKSNQPILVSLDAKTGTPLIGETRLPDLSTVYSSPVAAGDRVYLTGRDGTTLVLRHGNSLDVIATNKLDDEIDASAAIVDDEIFFRGKSHLYCIAKD